MVGSVRIACVRGLVCDCSCVYCLGARMHFQWLVMEKQAIAAEGVWATFPAV